MPTPLSMISATSRTPLNLSTASSALPCRLRHGRVEPFRKLRVSASERERERERERGRMHERENTCECERVESERVCVCECERVSKSSVDAVNERATVSATRCPLAPTLLLGTRPTRGADQAATSSHYSFAHTKTNEVQDISSLPARTLVEVCSAWFCTQHLPVWVRAPAGLWVAPFVQPSRCASSCRMPHT